MVHIIDRSQHPYKVGGRNLIANSRTLTVWGVDSQSATSEGRKITALKNPISTWVNTGYGGDGYRIMLSMQKSDIHPGDVYTLSMDVKTTGIVAGAEPSLLFSIFDNYNRATGSAKLLADNDGVWIRYQVTVTAPNYQNLEMMISFNGPCPVGATIEYKDPQIEYGPVATAYAYAPEELPGIIDKLMTAAGVANDYPVYDGPEIMEEDMDMDDMRQTGGYSSLYIVGLLPALIGGVRHG